jgi:hypothetical protein
MGNKITTKFMNGCAGKVQHRTFLGAEYALDHNRQNKNADIYKCKECGFFHIGTQKKNKSKKRIRFKNPEKVNNEHKKKYKSVKKMKY